MTAEWLTQEQAEEYLQISRTTLYRWQQEGRLPVYKFGKLRRYKREDLDALAEPIAPEGEEDRGRPWDRDQDELPERPYPSHNATGTDHQWRAAINAEAQAADYDPEVVRIALGAVGTEDNLAGLQKEAERELCGRYRESDEEAAGIYDRLAPQLEYLLGSASLRLPEEE